MKKIIAIFMLVGSLAMANEYFNVETFVEYSQTVKASEQWGSIKENVDKLMIQLNDFSTIDYLQGEVQVQRNLWDAVDKETKTTILMTLLVHMFDKTGSTDIMVSVDYTTVLWTVSDRVLVNRV